MAGSDWVYEARPNSLLPNKPPVVNFRDLNCDYTILAGQNLVLEEDDALKNQIKNILSTPRGSEHFEPNYGSNLPYRLFDPISPFTGFIMEEDTVIALTDWMFGRITIILPRITPLPDEDGYRVLIPYTKVQTSQQITLFAFDVLR